MTLLLTAPLLGAGPQPATGTPDGVAFGARVQPRSGETDQQAVQRMESLTGRKLDVVREFLLWDTPFPDDFHTWLRDTGHTMILSIRSRRTNGTDVRWADIVAAQPGSPLHTEIVRWADRIRDYGAPLYFAFNHEPESAANRSMGEAPDFIAAWRKIHGIFQQRDVDNARFMWIMTDYAFFVGSQARNDAAKWYPGDAYLEAMAADAYNWYDCRPGVYNPWKSLESIIAPFRDFGAAHPAEELWLAEWASTEDPAQTGRKADWIAQAQALFKRPDYAQFHGVAYFHHAALGTCDWYVDSSPSSASAFGAMGRDPFYDVADPPPTEEVSFVAAATTNGNRIRHSVTVPASVRAGDTLLLFFTGNATSVTTTGPAGWTAVRSAEVDGLRGRLWTRTATAADAASTVTVTSSAYNMADLKVVAFRGTGSPALDVHAMATDTVNRAQHTAPSVTPTVPSGRVVVYWGDKSATNTDHAVPAPLTELVPSTTGSGRGHITASVAAMPAPGAGVPTGTFTAVGTAPAPRAVMYTLVLRP